MLRENRAQDSRLQARCLWLSSSIHYFVLLIPASPEKPCDRTLCRIYFWGKSSLRYFKLCYCTLPNVFFTPTLSKAALEGANVAKVALGQMISHAWLGARQVLKCKSEQPRGCCHLSFASLVPWSASEIREELVLNDTLALLLASRSVHVPNCCLFWCWPLLQAGRVRQSNDRPFTKKILWCLPGPSDQLFWRKRSHPVPAIYLFSMCNFGISFESP